MVFLLILIIAILSIIFFIDLVIQFSTWQARIKIGRWQEQAQWQKAVQKKALAWLKKTPTVKLTDQNRLIVLDMLKGNYKRSAIQHWQEAALVMGLTEQYRKSVDPKIKNSIDRYFAKKLSADGNWKTPITESDGVILAYALIQLPWIEVNTYKPAFDAVWQLIQNLKGEDGTVSYKGYTRNYRYVDTLGFICPFLVEYGQRFDIPNAVDLALKQIEEYNHYGMMGDEFLPCHTYSLQHYLPVGLFGWGRGLGWYAIGLMDSWKSLDNHHPKKAEMETWVKKFAQTAIKHQRANGSWGWNVLQTESRPDSSTVAILSWFLKNAAVLPEFQETATAASQKGVQYLMSVTRRDGAIDFAQGDTKGIGVYAQTFDILPFAQGMALRIN